MGEQRFLFATYSYLFIQQANFILLISLNGNLLN